MQKSKCIILKNKQGYLVTTEGKNLTLGTQTNIPIRGTGEYTLPTTLNSMHQQNENIIELIKILNLALET